MEFSGKRQIASTRERVWDMLNDPNVLKACLPGCQSLEGNAIDGFTASVKIGIGPVKATFAGSVELLDLNPLRSYRIVGSGKGGAAGFASGEAMVLLDDFEDGTLLTYVAQVKIGGKLVQLGSRLLQSTTAKLTDQFFAAFAEHAAEPTRDASVGPQI